MRNIEGAWHFSVLFLGDCDDDQFRCGNSHCVNVDKLCDGENDCGDFSDERCNTSAVIPMPVDQPILVWQDTDQYVGHPDILPIAPSVDHMQLPSMSREGKIRTSFTQRYLQIFKFSFL